MKYRIKGIAEAGAEPSRQSQVKALRPYEEYDGPEIEVLGVPYGGHIVNMKELDADDIDGLTPGQLQQQFGVDSYGERFHAETDIMMRIGDETRLTYYHGFGPDSPFDWQDPPQVIGVARYTRKDEQGYWFTAKLDASEPLAQRIITANASGGTAKASTGAVSHMVRQSGANVDVWPVGELAIFDINEWREPANNLADVMFKSSDQSQVEEPQGEAIEAVTVKIASRTEPSTSVDINIRSDEINGDLTMSEETTNTTEVGVQFDMAEFMDGFKGAVAEAVSAATESATAAAKKAVRSEIKAAKEETANDGGVLYQAPSIKSVTKLGFSDEPEQAFKHYLRTGDNAVRAALQEDTDAEGGFLVPNDFYDQIVEKRDQMSIARAAGALVIQTDLKVVDVPTENAKMANFAIVAEEGAANQNEPTFAQVQITAYKFNKLVKISDELVADEKANLMPYLTNAFGRAMALTENNYFLVGTGSSQPQGAITGGTVGVTAASATAIAAGEVIELYYDASEYRNNGVWAMHGDTEATIRSLTGDSFLFASTPAGEGNDMDTLMSKPVFNSDSVATIATGNKTILFGDWSYYGLVERASMSIRRLNELYAANGQIGLLATFRVGGAVLQAEAFQVLQQA